MSTTRWLLALPLALAATLGTSHASSVRDDAKLFSADAVQKAESELNRIERESKIAVNVETVDSLNGLNVTDATRDRAEKSGEHGLFVLIAKQEGKIDVLASKKYNQAINRPRRLEIQNAFISGLKRRDFDAGLLAGVRAIDTQVSAARAEAGPQPGRVGAGAPGRAGAPARRGNPEGGFGLGSLLGIGLLIVGGLFLFRLIGSLFGGGNRGYAGPGNPMMGRPGYGAPGGGGGFMSSLFGGIGGAMAGNWLYDQFSGRQHGGSGYTDSSTSGGGASSAPDTWAGGGDTGGGDWGGGGGGGGDWGGGGGGGGGDWGGGGGGDTGGGDW